jgi:hypothetical protein
MAIARTSSHGVVGRLHISCCRRLCIKLWSARSCCTRSTHGDFTEARIIRSDFRPRPDARTWKFAAGDIGEYFIISRWNNFFEPPSFMRGRLFSFYFHLLLHSKTQHRVTISFAVMKIFSNLNLTWHTYSGFDFCPVPLYNIWYRTAYSKSKKQILIKMIRKRNATFFLYIC